MKKFFVLVFALAALTAFAAAAVAESECTQDKEKTCCKSSDKKACSGSADKKTCCKSSQKASCQSSKGVKTAKASKDATAQNVVIDPVCGMDVKVSESKYSYKYQDKTYYFCSKSCMKTFEKDPSKFIGKQSKQ